MPLLPRETKAERRWMSPSATPATQSAAASGDQRRPSAPHSAISATPATQNEGGCEIVPRLPRKTKVDVTKRHACHAKCRGVTGDQRRLSAPHSAISATPATQNESGCEIAPRLPRETKVDVTKCHACHAKCRGANGDQWRPSAPHSAISATPATQNEGGCLLVTRLPRKTKVDVTKCHACHAKCRGVTGDQRRLSAPHSAISATPATQNESGCEIVPRLARETKVDVSKCHACHVRRKWMSPSATPATQSAAASPATNGDQARHTVPRLPRKTKVDVRLCHAWHVKRRWMSPSATPATQSAVASPATNGDQARHTVP